MAKIPLTGTQLFAKRCDNSKALCMRVSRTNSRGQQERRSKLKSIKEDYSLLKGNTDSMKTTLIFSIHKQKSRNIPVDVGEIMRIM